MSTLLAGSAAATLSVFLRSTQYALFPLVLAVLAWRAPERNAVPSGFVLPSGWLMLAVGAIRSDPFGAIVALTLIISVGGSITSLALCYTFVRTPQHKLARILAYVHIVYLIALAVTCIAAGFLAEPKSRPGGGY